MGLEDRTKCSDIGLFRVPCEIDDNCDGEASVCSFDGCWRNGRCSVKDALQAIVHAVPVQVGAVPQPPAVGFRGIAFGPVRPPVRCWAKLVAAHQGRDALHHVDAWFGLGKQSLATCCGRPCDHQNEKKEGHARAACTLVRTSAHHGTLHRDTFEPIPLPLHLAASRGAAGRRRTEA